MSWTIGEITAVSVFCKPREPWQQLSLPTKFCKVCGGHRLYRTLEDNGPPYDRENDYTQCYDCDYQSDVTLYLRRKSLLLSYGARANPRAWEQLAEMKERYRITDEDAAREPGPEHDPARWNSGTFVMSEPTTIGKVIQRSPLDATPIDPREDS